jgi:hypothetical protein
MVLGGRMRMGRKRHTAEQIITKLREAEVELAKGQTLNFRSPTDVFDETVALTG